jgi:hypothetical protein
LGKTTISLKGRIGTTEGKFPTDLKDFIAESHPSHGKIKANLNCVELFVELTYLILMEKSRTSAYRTVPNCSRNA